MPDFLPDDSESLRGLADYHCHCDFSADAVGSIDQYCRSAIEREISEICFTTHYDDNFDVDFSDNFIVIKGERQPVSPDNLQAYVDAVSEAHDKYFPAGLAVKLGLEFGWWPGGEASANLLKERFDFDYFLCGIHTLQGRCIGRGPDMEAFKAENDMDGFLKLYFDEIAAAAKSGLFDAIAHPGYYLRWGEKYFGPEIGTRHKNFVGELASVLIETSTGIEINTSGLRHGLDSYFPPVDFVNSCRRAGVALRWLGSDAHKPEDVAFDFEAARVLIDDPMQGCED